MITVSGVPLVYKAMLRRDNYGVVGLAGAIGRDTLYRWRDRKPIGDKKWNKSKDLKLKKLIEVIKQANGMFSAYCNYFFGGRNQIDKYQRVLCKQ
jgi:hypothetical protein